MASPDALADALAAAFLDGAWTEASMAARGRACIEPAPSWIPRVARRVLAAYRDPPRDRPRELAAYVEHLLDGDGRIRAIEASLPRPRQVVRRRTPHPQMARRFPDWPVPGLPTLGDLARHLGVEPGALAWYADVRRLGRSARDERLRHYRVRVIPRAASPVPRVLEIPKRDLKQLQRYVLHDILDHVPPHDAAHGFRPGRSAVTHAQAHTGRRVILRFDLEDFFASVSVARVYGIFRLAGYPESVAHALTGLTTTSVPADVLAGLTRPTEPLAIAAFSRLERRLKTPHLPQGAPCSPALANLAAFGLDRRLAGLARRLGPGTTYTRYADDLVLSGGEHLVAHHRRLRDTVRAIARREGFVVNERKSALTTRAGRQHVCGIVVNARTNVARDEYDVLKAILHNAASTGLDGQNRDGHADFRAHLRGRIAWVGQLNPARGERLRARLDALGT